MHSNSIFESVKPERVSPEENRRMLDRMNLGKTGGNEKFVEMFMQLHEGGEAPSWESFYTVFVQVLRGLVKESLQKKE